MTIEKTGNFYRLTCDNCGQVFDEEFDSFDEAVDAKVDNGWKSKKRHGNWEDWCPECCQESEEK